MNQKYRDITLSQEMKATIFISLFTAVFILASFVVGFQLGLFAISMLVSVGLTLVYPRSGLFSMVFLTMFFERFYTLAPLVIGRDSYKLYPIDVFIVAIIASILLRVIFQRWRFHFTKIDGILVAFFAVVTGMFAVSVVGFGNQSMEVALSTWKSYVFYGLLYFCMPLLLTKKEQLVSFVKVYFASAIAILIFLMIGIVRGEGLWTEYTPLSTSGVRILAFPHAFYLSMALIAAFYSAKHWFVGKNPKRWWYFAVVALWMIGVLGSLMRHLWLGLGISTVVMLWIMTREHRTSILKAFRVFIIGGAIIGIALLYFLTLFPHSAPSEQMGALISTMTTRVTSIGNASDESIAWRGVVWSSAFHAFSQNIFSGTGFGVSVPVEIADYREFVEIRNIHNSWLALLIQTGLLGSGLFVLFLSRLTYRAWRLRSKDALLETAKYVTMGILIFHSIIFLSQPYLETNLLSIFFWINLGVMRTLLAYEDSRNK